MLEMKEWDGFEGRLWKEEINVRQFIQDNYTPYDGNEDFLAEPTEATNKLWGALQKLQKEERAKGGVLDMETEVVTGITAYGPGYIDESLKDLETIVGLQTDKPLKRAFMPYGGIKMAVQACETYRYLVGSNTGLPFVRSETLLHYNLNPSDYMWLYQHDKELFYTCLDAAALQSEIFSYKSFVYNFNLYILKDANILDELSRYSKCYEAVLELLFKSDSIMQNSVIRQIKLCRNEDTIKQNNRLDAINKWFNSLNKIG